MFLSYYHDNAGILKKDIPRKKSQIVIWTDDARFKQVIKIFNPFIQTSQYSQITFNVKETGKIRLELNLFVILNFLCKYYTLLGS